MLPSAAHTPGPPPTGDPPQALLDLADGLQHPLAQQVGITTTADGRWALFVTVPADTPVPITAIESRAHGLPVVYAAASKRPQFAGPAYPPG